MRWSRQLTLRMPIALVFAMSSIVVGLESSAVGAVEPIAPPSEIAYPRFDDVDTLAFPNLWFHFESDEKLPAEFSLYLREDAKSEYLLRREWTDTVDDLCCPEVIRTGNAAITCVTGRLRSHDSGEWPGGRSILCWRVPLDGTKEICGPVELAFDAMGDYYVFSNGEAGGTIWYRTGYSGAGDLPVSTVSFDPRLKASFRTSLDPGLQVAANQVTRRRLPFDVVAAKPHGFLAAWLEMRVDLVTWERDYFACMVMVRGQLEAAEPARCLPSILGPNLRIDDDGASVSTWSTSDCLNTYFGPNTIYGDPHAKTPGKAARGSALDQAPPRECRRWMPVGTGKANDTSDPK